MRDHRYDFTIMVPDIDERAVVPDGDMDRERCDPVKLVLAICKAKSAALLDQLCSSKVILITCDQVINYQGTIREKPQSHDECRSYMKTYSAGWPAETVSGIRVVNTANGKSSDDVDIARQYFKPIPDEIVDALLRKGDIMHCAGGFMIDDPLLEPYLDRREGDEDSIMGMPMKLLAKLIAQVQ